MIAAFEYQNPVRVVFGENKIDSLGSLLPEKKILLLYGQGSIWRNGTYDRVKVATRNFNKVEFGGIEANPVYETLMKAVELGRKEKIEFILAVGGGSVIDGAKFVAAAIPYDGDGWDILTKKGVIKSAVPLGTVLTLPATGTEMNANSVISRAETKEKLSFASPFCYPVFSIMDISLLPSLPKRQRINGVIDAFVHTTEQYMTYPVNAKLQDRLAEGIFSTLIEDGYTYIHEPGNKEAATNVLYTAMMALNGWLSTGVPTDWSIHMVGHELTALIGVDHGISLAIILPPMYRRLVESKKEKLAQYARRVWGVEEEDTLKAALKGIDLTEKFFNDLGAVTRLSHYTDDKKFLQDEICSRFESRKWLKFGEKGEVTIEVVREVIEMAW